MNIKRALLINETHIAYPCDKCKTWHTHGRSDDRIGEGHRASHCEYDTDGYILKLYTNKQLKELIAFATYTLKEKEKYGK